MTWSSIWDARPDAVVRFDVEPHDRGSMVRWTLHVEEPAPPPEMVRQMRFRLQVLVQENLRNDHFDG